MTVAGGVVWVALPERGLGRIDPASNQSSTVPMDRCCDGELAAGEEPGGWRTRGRTLLRVTRNRLVAARIPLSRTTGQRPHQVAVGDGAVWVTSAGTRRGTANLLWRVDPASNQVIVTLVLGQHRPGAS